MAAESHQVAFTPGDRGPGAMAIRRLHLARFRTAHVTMHHAVFSLPYQAQILSLQLPLPIEPMAPCRIQAPKRTSLAALP